nr:MAG TPA: hypothetical protein [Caudoviricetes sp.]
MPTTTIAETATKIDAPLIISLAALVLAILSPLVTAWVQGKYRLKEIKQEAQRDAQRHEQQYYTEHRTEVIENYIRAGMRLSVTESTADIAAFEVASGEYTSTSEKSTGSCLALSTKPWKPANTLTFDFLC